MRLLILFCLLIFKSEASSSVEPLVLFLEQRGIVPQEESYVLAMDREIESGLACLLLVRTMRYVALRYQLETGVAEDLARIKTGFDAMNFLYKNSLLPDRLFERKAREWISRAEFVNLSGEVLDFMLPEICATVPMETELYRDVSRENFARRASTCLVGLKVLRVPSNRLFLGSVSITAIETFQLLYRLVVRFQDMFREGQNTADEIYHLQRGL